MCNTCVPYVPDNFRWLTDLIPGRYAYLEPYLVGYGTVQPSAAKVVLDLYNRDNRHKVVSQVKMLAEQMAAGIYLLNGETVVFDNTSNMRQGQHRMEGCVQSGCSFETFIVAGLPSSVFQTYDQHQKRSLDAVLSSMGKKHPRILAGGVSVLHYYFRRGVLGRRASYMGHVSNPQLLDTMTACGGWLEDSAAATSRMGRFVKVLRGAGNVCAAHYLFSLAADQNAADAFFNNIRTMSIPKDPKWWGARILAKTAFQQATEKNRDKRLSDTALMGMTVQAWNALARGEAVKELPFQDGDEFPAIYGLRYIEGLPLLADNDEVL